jgi:putative N6-adenine-specific DNA methylase
MKYVAKTLYGLEGVLTKELESLGAQNIRSANRAVTFTGNKALLYKVNYCSRAALSYLKIISEFKISSKEDLYKNVYDIDWSEIMDQYSTFSVVPVVSSRLFTHTGYPGLVVKDAIADYFRNKYGRRPTVDAEDPTIVINLHIANEQVTISADSSVVPLYKRGYRVHQGIAPLNEVLAAGILMLSGWDSSISFLDPMCGSGTILIEAGLIANRIPAGKFRKRFGFTKWRDFDEKLFNKVKDDEDNQVVKSNVVITGSDISEQAVSQSTENIRSAGLSDLISVSQVDFRDVRPVGEEGILVFNPPYGHRLNPDETITLYKMIGTSLKHNFPGHTAWILTSGKENLNSIGLKPVSKYALFNGALECILSGYELYKGTRKQTGD